MRLIQFLIALHDDYETIRVNLLHHHSLPTLYSPLAELMYEKTSIHNLNTKTIEIVMASIPKSQNQQIKRDKS